VPLAAVANAAPPHCTVAEDNLVDRRIGPYRILELLGKGGMGQVYRALDSKLGREVAIKVLPPDLTADPDRLARFEREARVLASFNHPHIAAIYGFEDEEGIRALILELVDGPTLAERLAEGPLTVREAMAVARDIAAALEAAHGKGVVHRDLKPANIKVARTGSVKVLDFGLAKFADAIGGVDTTATPTLDQTRDGLILGTAAYMSPEQARGKPVDKRTDIWAFGCVLYEMLTGRMVHAGETFSDVIVAILEREPDWSALPPDVPPGVQRLLRRCLQKERTRRLHDIADARLELEEVLADNAAASVAGIEVALRPWWVGAGWRRLALAGGAGAVLGAALGVAAMFATTPPRTVADAVETRFQVLPPPGAVFDGSLAVSPDGRWVAFVAMSGGQSRLWLRSRRSVTPRVVEGTTGAREPFWSPDSRSVAFFAAGKLRRVTVPDGIPQSIADAPNPSGGTWNHDDVLLFMPSLEMPLQRVTATGGETVRVPTTDPSGGALVPNWPHFLPDGRHFLFYGRSQTPARSGVYVGSLDSHDSRLLVATVETRAQYTDGYVLFMREGALVAQPFDVKALAFTGKPTQAAERIAYDEANGASFSTSPSGVLAYWGASRRNGQIVLFGRGGNRVTTLGQAGEYSGLALSPDQRQLAVEHLGGEHHAIWLIDWDRQLPRPIVAYAWGVHHPLWSPDGRSIVYTGNPGQGYSLYRKVIAGDSPDERLTLQASGARPTDWGANALVYEQAATDTAWDLWYLSSGDPRTPVAFLRTTSNEVQGHLSPTGRAIAYTSDESGTLEVYLESFPAGGDKLRVSDHGGAQPVWRSDGRELFYLSADRQLMAVEVRSQAPLLLGAARALFFTGVAGPIAIAPASNNHYAVSADGQRFYVNTSVEQLAVAPITVVLNWTLSIRP